MPESKQSSKKTGNKKKRLRLTIQLSLDAYYAIERIQRQHRIEQGRAIPKWRVLDAAVRAYAEQRGIKLGE